MDDSAASEHLYRKLRDENEKTSLSFSVKVATDRVMELIAEKFYAVLRMTDYKEAKKF